MNARVRGARLPSREKRLRLRIDQLWSLLYAERRRVRELEAELRRLTA